MKEHKSGCDRKAVMKFAGAFIAWVIGSGFATGQEILQFFTSYGYLSYGVVILDLIGFLLLGKVLMTTGYLHRNDSGFNHFTYFCGRRIGTFYSWLIPITILLIMAVLISGAGYTLFEYYGVNPYIGSLLMASMVLCAYLVGFERLVKIVSAIGPMIILFTLFVGLITVFRDFGSFSTARQYEAALEDSRSAPNWVISSVLYLSLNFLSGSTYFTALGMTARSRNDAKWGAVFGAATLIVAIACMNTAILLNLEHASTLAIPALYLARKISYLFGAAFSVILVLGIFSSCSTMMWTVCSRFSGFTGIGGRKIAVAVSIFTFVLGLLPFGRLVNVFYPFVGYLGLIFIGCVVYYGISNIKKQNEDK